MPNHHVGTRAQASAARACGAKPTGLCVGTWARRRVLGEPYRYPWGIGALLQDGSPILLQQELEER